MATSGFFTYYDLYGGKPENYHYKPNIRLLSPIKVKLLSIANETIASALTTTVASVPTTTNLTELVSSTTIQPSNELYKLVQLVPFAYLQWFLIGLAILLTLLLIIIFICYCRCCCCRKNSKSQK